MQQWNLMVIGYPPPRHSAHWALRGPGVFLCSDFECFWTVQQEMETHHDHRALRAHIFWFCSTELNSPNSISLRLLFLFSMQVCSMCLVKLLLPTALSLISISFLRKRDWLGDPIAQCSRCQLKDAWIRVSSPLAASPWSSTPSWRDRRISKNSGWFRFEIFFNRKSNIWHMYHRQKKRSCKESSVRWRRRWGSWTGQSDQ